MRRFAFAAALALVALAAPAAAEEMANGRLRGTLLIAPNPGPGDEPVLILPSNGPTDRNGDNAFGIRGGVYRQIAEGLAARGISSLRVDKRGFDPAQGDAALRNRTYGFAASTIADPGDPPLTIDVYAADARAWASALRTRLGVRCVWLLGHGEGGWHALMAAQNNREICGVILLTAPGRRAADIIRNDGPDWGGRNRILDSLEAGRTVSEADFDTGLRTLFPAIVQPYQISLFRIDPAALVRRYRGPVLVVWGDTDYQIDPRDGDRLGGARRGVTVTRIPGMNHALKPAPRDREANSRVYADPRVLISPGLVDAVAGYIEAN